MSSGALVGTNAHSYAHARTDAPTSTCMHTCNQEGYIGRAQHRVNHETIADA